jgi:hypothetical protein
MEEEFTVARLFVSKMKSEAKNLVSRAATLEQQQAEANRKTEEMEKELSESRLTIVQVGLKSVSCQVFFQCSGSGSGIRCLLDPWIRVRKKTYPGSGYGRKPILDQDPQTVF